MHVQLSSVPRGLNFELSHPLLLFFEYVSSSGQTVQRAMCIKGQIWPPLLSQKLKVVFHQFHPIGLLEE